MSTPPSAGELNLCLCHTCGLACDMTHEPHECERCGGAGPARPTHPQTPPRATRRTYPV